MMKLIEAAEVIRSKNAGPYELTFDIIFKDHVIYDKVRENQLINASMIAQLYHIEEQDVLDLVYFTPAKAVKATIRRHIPSGNVGERDVYGAQQHAPLLSIELDI